MIELDGFEYLKDEDLSKYTTYRVGGFCDYMVFPKNIVELKRLLSLIKNNKINYKIIGNGSNVVFSSKRFEGIIINLDYLNNYSFDNNKLECESGCSLIKVAMDSINHNLGGLDFAIGIPGSIGGAIYMNAGCYGSDISNVLSSVTYIDEDLSINTINNTECLFGYRDSLFKHHKYVIISACFILNESNKEEIMKVVSERIEKRNSSQPLDKPNAGSVFRNPEGVSAGKLIEDAGLKGYTIGGAMVSYKHANFIVNEDNATGEDIRDLIYYVKNTIKEKYNIDLVLEQELVNF